MASFKTAIIQKIVLKLDGIQSASTTSTFQKTGKITPDEFVKAGDFLTENFPTWQWCAGLPDKRRSHLPADKQFIICKDVPCLPHPDMGDSSAADREVEGVDGEESWIDTGPSSENVTDELSANVADLEIAPDDGPAVENDNDNADEDDEDLDDDDVESLDGFDYDEAAIADDDQATLTSGTNTNTGNDANVVETRTYDFSISYDVHYSTPRVWLFGYDASHNPLKEKEWQKDFSPEHLNKTVTYESHPHLAFSCPSIHPCKHAAAMLRILPTDGSVDCKYYLLVFLKFIQAIIPNIEYDYTGQFEIPRS